MSKNQEYKVLARKYRPQKFADLIGQESLVTILSNAIVNNRIAHAYVLTGVRGVGKTTTARLIAMSLNCQKRESKSFESCGSCESCVSIRQDTNLDVIGLQETSSKPLTQFANKLGKYDYIYNRKTAILSRYPIKKISVNANLKHIVGKISFFACVATIASLHPLFSIPSLSKMLDSVDTAIPSTIQSGKKLFGWRNDPNIETAILAIP